MSLIHNRMGAVTLAVAATVLLLGAGCQKPQENRTPILDQGTGSLPGAAADASAPLPTKWAEYRSDKLGITIPYPEGWYVSESGNGDQGSGTVVGFYPDQPPTESDMPARVQVQVSSQTIEQVRATFPEIVEESTMNRAEQSVFRIVHPRDIEPAADEIPRLSYLWARGSTTLVVEGVPDDPVLEEIVNRLLRKDGGP